MAQTKYKVEKTTIDKIRKLFAYRRITDMLKVSGLDKDKNFVADIINVQYHIYMLDGYLESQWELNKKDLKLYWMAIFVALENMGYNSKSISGMVSEISEYEKIERNCRKDKWPTKESIEDFYITKSCDVRLIRKLIYKARPETNKVWKEKGWWYYDIITEINDDISDVQEDLNTLNGNRYLISILRKGTDKTYRQYHSYLDEITESAKEHFDHRIEKGNNKQLATWTLDSAMQTLKLLETHIKSKNIDKLSGALLLSHMK